MTFKVIHRGQDYATIKMQSMGYTYELDVALAVADEIEAVKATA